MKALGARERLCHLCYKFIVNVDHSRLICENCEKITRERFPEGTKEREDVEAYLNAFAEQWKKTYGGKNMKEFKPVEDTGVNKIMQTAKEIEEIFAKNKCSISEIMACFKMIEFDILLSKTREYCEKGIIKS